MKNLILTLVTMLMAGLLSHAQLVIRDSNQNIVNNETISITGTPGQFLAQAGFYFSNAGYEDVNLFVRVLNSESASGMTHNICWKGNCLAEGVLENARNTGNPIELKSNQRNENADFQTEIKTNGQVGATVITYEFYDLNDLIEPVQLTINFDNSSTSNLAPVASNRVLLEEASPNPARGFTFIPYNLPRDTQNAQLVIRNLLGNLVMTENIDVNTQRIRIETRGLNNGIYIYSLMINNQPVMSKRLVVAN